jgi:peptidoglycan/LPS O-acetylase OafA/YrhL
MIEFLSGSVTLAFILAAVFFLRFWRRTRDRLFLAFSVAFALLALNQILAFILNVYSEPQSFIYWLRVIGFLLILVAIMDKNLTARKGPLKPGR